MPNIRSQRVYASSEDGPDAAEIVGSDGRSYTLTKAIMQAFYLGTIGNASLRRAAVIALIKDAIVLALGAEQITLADLDLDFDSDVGGITDFTTGR